MNVSGLTNNSLQCFWERQGRDKLCAVHSLNSLLQGPSFSEVELGTLANELDAHERQIMGGEAVGPSQNVDADGNFSLGVMERALEKYNLSLVNLGRPDIRKQVMANPQSESAYICNSHARAHWYTIRKVHSKWYDLDSLKPAPTFISDFALAAFLEATMQSGFTVFVIRSRESGGGAVRLPEPDKFLTRTSLLQPHQMYISDKDMDRLRDEHRAKEETEMGQAKAIEEDGDPKERSGPAFTMVVPADKRKVETDWSKLGGGNTLSCASAPSNVMPLEMDDDLAAAIAASLGDMNVPAPGPEPESGIQLSFRYKSDEPVKRTFSRESTLSEIFQFIEWKNLKEGAFPSVGGITPLASTERYSMLKAGFPKKEKFIKCQLDKQIYLDSENVTGHTLSQRGFAVKEALTVQIEGS